MIYIILERTPAYAIGIIRVFVKRDQGVDFRFDQPQTTQGRYLKRIQRSSKLRDSHSTVIQIFKVLWQAKSLTISP